MLRATALCLFALPLAYNAAKAQSSPPGISLFPDCHKPELLTHGRPVMMFVDSHLGMGVSIAKDTFKAGEATNLNVWVDNQSDAPVNVYNCSFVGLFLSRGFEILDRDGHRILSKAVAEACSHDPREVNIFVCHRDIRIEIPAHTCLTRDDSDFSINVARDYGFAPGEYTLRLRPNWKTPDNYVCRSEEPGHFQRQLGDLTFTVTP